MPFGARMFAGQRPVIRRSTGYFAGYYAPGYVNPSLRGGWWYYGRRRWLGRGKYRGFRNWYRYTRP